MTDGRLDNEAINRRLSPRGRGYDVPSGGYNLIYKASFDSRAMKKDEKVYRKGQVEFLQDLKRLDHINPNFRVRILTRGSVDAMGNFRKKVARRVNRAAIRHGQAADNRLSGPKAPLLTGRTRASARTTVMFNRGQTVKVRIRQGEMAPHSRFRYIGPLHDGRADRGPFNHSGERFWFWKATAGGANSFQSKMIKSINAMAKRGVNI